MAEINEHRQIGPPGTGKTTWIVQQVNRAVKRGRRPMLCSLTKAASSEAGSRMEFGVDFEPSQVRTLHSHCFHTLGRPQLVSTEEHLIDWNQWCDHELRIPAWKLSKAILNDRKKNEEGAKPFKSLADQMYERSLVYRARMTAPAMIPAGIRSFMESFSEWRKLSGLCDFTDLIERCLKESPSPICEPDVLFVDEAQDHDRLELTLIRKWAAAADWLVLVGDPDQNLYDWKGAEPEAFYATDLPPERTTILEQSYRVPRAVHAVAANMINRVEGRVPVSYLPRDAEGEARGISLKLRRPIEVVKQVESVTKSGLTAMILVSCAYQIRGIIKALRERGLPFHNPFASNRGDFNPMDANGTTARRRLMSFLKPHSWAWGNRAELWTWGELAEWIEPIDTKGFLKHGMKSRIVDHAEDRHGEIVTLDNIDPFLTPEGIEMIRGPIADDPLNWFRDRLNRSKLSAFNYPFAVLGRAGPEGLREKPKIIVGTIHSVKGGEADVVFVFPDLSPRFWDQMRAHPDPIWRLFYVAITRAKEAVFLCEASGPLAVQW